MKTDIGVFILYIKIIGKKKGTDKLCHLGVAVEKYLVTMFSPVVVFIALRKMVLIKRFHKIFLWLQAVRKINQGSQSPWYKGTVKGEKV